MRKKKLSALELKLKKMAVLANDKFATKENTYTKGDVDAALSPFKEPGFSVVDGKVCQTFYEDK